MPERTPQPRYDGLDAIRAGAMLLGLAYHATYAWYPNVGAWYLVQDGSPVEAMITVAGLLHAFRMQVFFALSGFFSHLVFERRGPTGFLSDRSRRLVVPLLFALPVVLALDLALRRWSASLELMSPQFVAGTDFHLAPVHLWFLVYLFTLCLAAWAAPRWDGPSRVVRRALRFPPLLLLALALPTCAALGLHPEIRPDLALWPLPFEWLHYGWFFAFGWWLWPSREGLEPLRRWALPFLGAGLALGLFVYTGPRQWTWWGPLAGGVVGWLMTLGGFGLAFRVAPKERPWLRFLVESSYWVYLVHYPVVMALQVLFAQTAWPGLLEYLATTVLTFAFALLTFALVVRRTALGPWLGVRR